MKNLSLFRLTSVFLTAVIVSCGTSIRQAHNFKPNKAPVVSVFSLTYIGGDTFSSTKLVSGMPFSVVVEASDPENSALNFNLSATNGTFSTFNRTDTGITTTFYLGQVSGNEQVTITLTVTDPKNASFVQTLDVGTGKTGPGLTVTPPSNQYLSPKDSVTATVSCDSTGYYRVYLDNTITTADQAEFGSTVTAYASENTTDTVTFLGPESTETEGVRLAADTVNRLWVVFKDNNSQYARTGFTITVEGDSPTVRSCYPANGATKVSLKPTVSVLFSKEMSSSTITASTVTLTSPAGTSVAGTVSYLSDSETVTFTPSVSLDYSTDYTVWVSQTVTDTVGSGNPMTSDYTAVFQTISQGTIPVPEAAPAPGTYTGAQNVTLSCGESGATIAYTVDGTVPTVVKSSTGTFSVSNGLTYDGTAVAISANTTLRAIAYMTGSDTSDVSANIYYIKLAAPTFGLSDGATYTTSQALTMNGPSDAAIYYTTDGTSPSASSSYISPGGSITISKNTTVRAISKKTGMTDSDETSATYYVRVGTPVFSLANGSTYDTAQSLYITADGGSTVYYTLTTDGSDPSEPTVLSTMYSGALSLPGASSSSCVYKIRAYTVKDGYEDSPESGIQTYTVDFTSVATPQFSPAAGVYSAEQDVTISCTTSGATIDYTGTVGGTATITGTSTGSVTVHISKTTTLSATASKGSRTTASNEGVYTLKVPTPTLATYASGTSTTAVLSCPGATISYSIYGSDHTGVVTSSTGSASNTTSVLRSTGNNIVTAIGNRDGWTDSDPFYNDFCLFVPYGTSASTINTIRQYKVSGATGELTDKGTYTLPNNELRNQLYLNGLFQGPYRNLIFGTTLNAVYYESTYGAYNLSFSVTYDTAALALHYNRVVYAGSSNYSATFDPKGYFLYGYFISSSTRYFRGYPVSSDGDFTTTGFDETSYTDINGTSLKLLPRPSNYSTTANIYGLYNNSNGYYKIFPYNMYINNGRATAVTTNYTAIDLGTTINSLVFLPNTSNPYFYATTGSSTTATVKHGALNATTGELSGSIGSTTSACAGDLVIALTSAGSYFLYIGSTGSGNTNLNLCVLTNGVPGAVSTAADASTVVGSGYYFTALSTDPSGRYLFAVATNGTASYVCVFTINATTGALTPTSGTSGKSYSFTGIPLKSLVAAP